MESNTGWPGSEFPENDDAYNQHANVKLTQEQLDRIIESGEPISQWIRDAIQQRIDREDARPVRSYHVRPYHASSGLRSSGEWPR